MLDSLSISCSLCLQELDEARASVSTLAARCDQLTAEAGGRQQELDRLRGAPAAVALECEPSAHRRVRSLHPGAGRSSSGKVTFSPCLGFAISSSGGTDGEPPNFPKALGFTYHVCSVCHLLTHARNHTR